MTADRRLDHLEAGLSPKEGTLLWLVEAQQHGSLQAYCGWLVDRPFAEAPLVHLHEQAVREVRRRLKGLPYEQRVEAEEQADRDVAFLFELVMILNVEAEKLVREGGLRYGMLFWEMRAISAETRVECPDAARSTGTDRWGRWREAVAALRSELSTKAGAVEVLEGRYLDGYSTLFPDALARWGHLREAVADLDRLGDDLDPGDAGRDRSRPDRDGIDLEAEAERILDTVRAHALDVLGDIEGSAAMLAPHFRGTTGAAL